MTLIKKQLDVDNFESSALPLSEDAKEINPELYKINISSLIEEFTRLNSFHFRNIFHPLYLITNTYVLDEAPYTDEGEIGEYTKKPLNILETELNSMVFTTEKSNEDLQDIIKKLFPDILNELPENNDNKFLEEEDLTLSRIPYYLHVIRINGEYNQMLLTVLLAKLLEDDYSKASKLFIDQYLCIVSDAKNTISTQSFLSNINDYINRIKNNFDTQSMKIKKLCEFLSIDLDIKVKEGE